MAVSRHVLCAIPAPVADDQVLLMCQNYLTKLSDDQIPLALALTPL
jgi:hypothetical protein